MGVKGLASFVRWKRLQQEERLSKCYLVVDGDNMLSFIRYDKCDNIKACQGGDYKQLAEKLETYFSDMKSCEIKPVVILGGTHDNDKLTVDAAFIQKAQEANSKCQQISAENQNDQLAYPVLSKVFFTQFLRRMEIPFAKCRYRPHMAIAALAGHLHCPVLSNDTEFWTLSLTCCAVNPDLRPAGGRMPFLVFRPRRLEELLGMSAEMWPLVSAVPGNNHLPREIFVRFWQLLRDTGPPNDRYIDGASLPALVRWLARQTSLTSALTQVLVTLSEEDKPRVKHFATNFSKRVERASLQFVAEGGPALRALLAGRPCVVPGHEEPWSPPAGRLAGVVGHLLSQITNLLRGQPFPWSPAVEDPAQPASGLAALPLLVRLGALLGAGGGLVTVVTRDGTCCRPHVLSSPTPGPPLEAVLLAGSAARRRALLSLLEVRPAALDGCPPLLQLLSAALLLWRRRSGERSGPRHVRAALLACLALAPANSAARLGLSAGEAAAWRDQAAPLLTRRAAAFHLPSSHLCCELQAVYRTVLAANSVLGGPLTSLDVDRTLHGPLMMNLGFSAAATHGDGPGVVSPPVDSAVNKLVTAVTEAIEAEASNPQAADTLDEETSDGFWRSLRGESELHPDLRTTLGLLSRLEEEEEGGGEDRDEERWRAALAELRVTTESGLLVLADTVYRRAVDSDPADVDLYARLCSALGHLQVEAEGGSGRQVRLADPLLFLCRRDAAAGLRAALSGQEMAEALEDAGEDGREDGGQDGDRRAALRAQLRLACPEAAAGLRAACGAAVRRGLAALRFLVALHGRGALTEAAVRDGLREDAAGLATLVVEPAGPGDAVESLQRATRDGARFVDALQQCLQRALEEPHARRRRQELTRQLDRLSVGE